MRKLGTPARVNTLVLSELDDIACKKSVRIGILNLRGTDIEYNPLFFSYALVYLKNAEKGAEEEEKKD